MAKFINFKVESFWNQAESECETGRDGDYLLNVDLIEEVRGDIFDNFIELVTTTGNKITLKYSLSADCSAPDDNLPVTTNYNALIRQAVTRAMTSNPGGVKTNVIPPLDTDDPYAKYNETLRVYWRSYENLG